MEHEDGHHDLHQEEGHTHLTIEEELDFEEGEVKLLFPPLVHEEVQIKDVVTDRVPIGVWSTGAPLLWQQGFRGLGCKIGVIDTGIDKTHPDLVGRVLFTRDYVGVDKPLHPHGTHVAGTIAATGKNKIYGVAPEASLVDYRVLDTNGSGSTLVIAKAINDAANDGCNVISMSLGGPQDNPQLRKAVQYAVSKGVLVVVAVGNEGPGRISYPGFYKEVVGVGAVNFSTRGEIEQAVFSNTNKEVDVCCEGFQVMSCIPNGGYADYSGTSMATPHVSGIAALLFQKIFTNTGKKPTEDVLYTMLKTISLDVMNKGVDEKTGAGYVTFYPSLPKRTSQDTTWYLPGMETGAPKEFHFQ
jgi:major intracellular serine protease